jgi:branched-chain amino acid transport system substrate-binding protein
MNKRLSVLLALLLTTSILLNGCNSKKAEEGNTARNGDAIKIGVLEPLTGANAAGGDLEVEGVKLANKLYPRVLGKKVELVIVDNKSDRVESSIVTSRLVEKDNVVAIIGSWGSSLSMAAGDTVRIDKVPAVGASCTNPLVTQGNAYYFRVCFLDPFQAQVMANYAFSKLHAKKIGIIKEVSSDYAVGLGRFFTDAFKKLSGDDNCIVAESNYNTGDRDFTAQLANIKSKNPDVIFAPGNFTESALLIKQARQLGIKAPFIGGDTWETPEFINIGGAAVEGATFSTFFSVEKPATEEAKKFISAFNAEYKDKKEPAAVTVLAYDAYILILDAIKRAGEANSVKIREKLGSTKNFQGAAGIINFDENRNAIKNAIIKTVKNGEFTYKYTYDINEKDLTKSLKK